MFSVHVCNGVLGFELILLKVVVLVLCLDIVLNLVDVPTLVLVLVLNTFILVLVLKLLILQFFRAPEQIVLFKFGFVFNVKFQK